MSTTTVTTPAPVTKSTFWSAFKNTTEIAAQDIKSEGSVILNDAIIEVKKAQSEYRKLVEYTSEEAAANVKSEVAKIQTLVNSKLAEIESKNTQVSSLQAAVVDLEADVAKAKTLAEKLVTAVT